MTSGLTWLYNRSMTNNNDIKKLIDERVKGSDIEKLFDAFVEEVTDTVIDSIPFPDDEDTALELIDYIIAKTFEEFNLQYIKGDDK